LLLVAEASHTDGALVDLVVPLLEPRHTLVLLAGGLGSLALAKWLRDRGRTDMPTLVESDGMHVLSGRVAADHVQVHAVVDRPGFGVFPSGRTSRTIDGLRCLFPGAHAHQNVVAAALASVTTFLRQATLLMNMATVERLGADHRVFDVGFTPSVARVVEALDRERLAIAAALELHLSPAAEALHERGLSPQGDLWAAVHGSYPLTRLPAAGTAVAGESLEEARRFFDVWVELAAKLDVPVPTYRALADLGRAVTGAGSAEAGSALESLGIAGMPVGGLVRFLETGG
jgi:opine dehydrogenase